MLAASDFFNGAQCRVFFLIKGAMPLNDDNGTLDKYKLNNKEYLHKKNLLIFQEVSVQ
jgi:hypothetical protein